MVGARRLGSARAEDPMKAPSDLALDGSKPLPFPPGESPFRIKGVAYRGHLDYVVEHVPGGVPDMLDGFRDPALRAFFEQRFLPSTFYDILPLVVAGYVCARQCRTTFNEFVRTRSRYQAQRDIRGIYKVLLKLVSPMHVIQRLPALQAQYLDFAADGQVNVLGDKKVELVRGALPGLLAPWLTMVNEAYVEVVLTAAGARTVLARTDAPTPDGSVHGVPTVKWRCEVTWE